MICEHRRQVAAESQERIKNRKAIREPECSGTEQAARPMRVTGALGPGGLRRSANCVCPPESSLIEIAFVILRAERIHTHPESPHGDPTDVS